MTLDVPQQEAKRIVGQAVGYAYGFRRTDDRQAEWCQDCRGDGCDRCGLTGFVKP